MEIIVLKGNLKDGLSVLGKLGSDNLSLPILRNCLIETQENKIKCSATNLELAITSFISAKIIKDGDLTVPLSTLISIIGNLENERINLETTSGSLAIKTENYNAKLQGIKKEEFPIIPKISNESEYIEFDSSILKETLLSVVNACQLTGNRQELNGILFDYQIGFAKFVATDSFRLAEKTIYENSFKTNIENKVKFIIPFKTVQELIRIIPDGSVRNNAHSSVGGDKIKVFYDKSQVLFKCELFELISRVINGEFPDYQAIIPKKTLTEVSVKKEEILNALKLTGSFTDRLNEIRLNVNDSLKNIEFFSSNPLLGENQYVIPCKITGSPIEVVFNWKYLIDGIKNIDSDNIIIGLSEENKPAIIKSQNSPDYFYILMPVKSS